AGPAVRGLFKRNPFFLQIRTNASFSAPAAKFGTAVLKAGGRTGAAIATFAGPGGTKVRYIKTASQFGGPARIKVGPATAHRIWVRGSAFAKLPCAHPKFGGAEGSCFAGILPEFPATVAAPGAPVGFTAKTPGAPPPAPNLFAVSVPNTTGLIAKSLPSTVVP